MRLSKEEREYFQSKVLTNDIFLDIMQEIIKRELGALNQLQLNDANWVIKRAYKDGQMTELRKLLELFTPQSEQSQ